MLAKIERKEVKKASIFAQINEDGASVKLAGQGIEIIEGIASIINSFINTSGMPFEDLIEIVKFEIEKR